MIFWASFLIPNDCVFMRVHLILGLSETICLINAKVFNLTKLSERLPAIGAGPIGLEWAQAIQIFGWWRHRRLCKNPCKKRKWWNYWRNYRGFKYGWYDKWNICSYKSWNGTWKASFHYSSLSNFFRSYPTIAAMPTIELS